MDTMAAEPGLGCCFVRRCTGHGVGSEGLDDWRRENGSDESVNRCLCHGAAVLDVMSERAGSDGERLDVLLPANVYSALVVYDS